MLVQRKDKTFHYGWIWDDVRDPGPTAARSIKRLPSLDTAKINMGQSLYQLHVGGMEAATIIYQLPVGVWKQQLF